MIYFSDIPTIADSNNYAFNSVNKSLLYPAQEQAIQVAIQQRNIIQKLTQDMITLVTSSRDQNLILQQLSQLQACYANYLNVVQSLHEVFKDHSSFNFAYKGWFKMQLIQPKNIFECLYFESFTVRAQYTFLSILAYAHVNKKLETDTINKLVQKKKSLVQVPQLLNDYSVLIQVIIAAYQPLIQMPAVQIQNQQIDFSPLGQQILISMFIIQANNLAIFKYILGKKKVEAYRLASANLIKLKQLLTVLSQNAQNEEEARKIRLFNIVDCLKRFHECLIHYLKLKQLKHQVNQKVHDYSRISLTVIDLSRDLINLCNVFQAFKLDEDLFDFLSIIIEQVIRQKAIKYEFQLKGTQKMAISKMYVEVYDNTITDLDFVSNMQLIQSCIGSNSN